MPKPLNRVWLCLGANLGNPEQQLDRACQLLSARDLSISRSSGLYLTKPWGKTDQPGFLNQVIVIETSLCPAELLSKIIEIEKDMGRIRSEKWGPRLIDIDILMYENQVVDLPELQIPHPLFHLRSFCLDPLCELEPDLLHPVLKRTMKELKEALNNREES